MPDLGILGWIIIGLLAGALAGFFVPGRERMGCIGTMLVGIAGGLIGGFLWVNVLGRTRPRAGSARSSSRCSERSSCSSSFGRCVATPEGGPDRRSVAPPPSFGDDTDAPRCDHARRLMVALAQPAEHRIVDPKVTGSTPVGHPT